MQIKVGSRVAVRAHGHSVTRTVRQVGDDYVVVEVMGQVQKVPMHWITSHVRKG